MLDDKQRQETIENNGLETHLNFIHGYTKTVSKFFKAPFVVAQWKAPAVFPHSSEFLLEVRGSAWDAGSIGGSVRFEARWSSGSLSRGNFRLSRSKFAFTEQIGGPSAGKVAKRVIRIESRRLSLLKCTRCVAEWFFRRRRRVVLKRVVLKRVSGCRI